MNSFTYAIGDLHGSFELARRGVEMARAHARGREHRLVFLGDYIDRGPRSRETVEFLMQLEGECEVICLKGNHEEMLERCLETRSAPLVSQWAGNGGRATLRSYSGPSEGSDNLDHVPEDHRRWFAGLPLFWADSKRVYVHAGLAPELSLDEQSARDLLWIRSRFLKANPDDFAEKRHIVHGHTIQWEGKRPSEPELLAHRTNLDTGAYGTGVLAVGIFASDKTGGPIDVLFAAS